MAQASGEATRTDLHLPPADELALIDAWRRAANYLSVGQIYLLDDPLLREPLTRDHVKPRLPGQWGTTPGLNSM
jgi:xylulose-5-phosphate/fructose-6-phosphate phosphoketolase